MKEKQKIKRQLNLARHKRVRAKIEGTKSRPRLAVFRSNKHIYAQLINDEEGKTLLSFDDIRLISGRKEKNKEKKTEIAFEVGRHLASLALEKKIKKVVFDKGKCRFHGRVKSLAEGARKGGLKF